MKKIYTIIALAAITALTTLTACKKSENENPDTAASRPKITVTTAAFADADLLAEKSPSNTQVASLPTGGNGAYSSQSQGEAGQIGEITRLATKTITTTRAEHSTEEFRAGDQIGIYVHSTPAPEQGELNHTTNTPYITDDGTTWRPVYLLGGAFTAPKYYITAYYPYAEALVDALTVPHTVATDQSDAPTDATTGKLELSNFLIARGATLENATTIATAQLNFAHAMALFEIKIHLPIMVEGRELDFLETMLIKGTETRASINLATGGVTVQSASAATIKPRRVSGTGKPGVLSVFEAIVVPQNIAEGAELLEIRCRMKDGSIESFDYSIPKQNWMAFKSGHRTSITLMPTAEVSFMGELPLLIDGLAHSAMALPIFVAKDLTWELSVDNIDWLTISATAGGTYGKKLSGSSTTGAMVNVYVKVDANSSQVMPRSGEMILRGYRTGGSEVAPAVYLAVQNYYNFAGAGSVWAAAAGEGSSPVAPFNANQTWTAASADDWVKLAGSATYGDGSPAATYSHVGSLMAGQLFFQADANNTAAVRSTTVKFSSDYADGTNFSYTVNQAAPEVVLVPAAAVAVTKDAGVGADLFTVTAPAGVKWKILSLAAEGSGVKDMTLALSVATGVEQVGTGEAVSVKGTYSANAESASRFTNVVVSFATHATAQQKTVKVTQESAVVPDYVVINGLRWKHRNVGATNPLDFGTYHNWAAAPAACTSLGSGWRLPTSAEYLAMHDAGLPVTYYNNGVGWSASNPGWIKYTHGLQFPASGRRSSGLLYVVGTYGLYWSSAEHDGNSAYRLYFTSSGVNPQDYSDKKDELTVRCVQDLPTEPQPPTADQIVEINGLKWTTGNLVANGATNCKVGASTDAGLYFQFGSLLGWKGGASGDGTGRSNKTTGQFYVGSSFNAANEIHVKPAVFTTIANIGATFPYQSGTNLYYFGYTTAPYSTAGQSIRAFTGYATGTLAGKGVGDPCTYYLGSPWRQPTYMETKALYNASTSTTYPGTWANGNTTPYLQMVVGGKIMQFPASGLRDTDGSMSYVGDYGYYWSESVYSADNGYLLIFSNGGVSPQNSGNRRYGFSVRCVQDLPTEPQPPTADQIVEINGLKWTTGNLVAAGGANAKVGAPTDGGLYFQFGSLVGWSAGANGNGVGIGSPALAVNVKPTGYTGTSVYTTCGYYSEGAVGSGLPAADVAATGIGDPCRFYLGSPWRTPTTAEQLAMTKAGAVTYNGSWTAASPGYIKYPNGLQFPASGLRNADGSMVNVGQNGYYWSESVYDAASGYNLGFGSGNVNPQGAYGRRNGFPVRCVQDLPTTPTPPTADQIIEIGGLKWTTGNLVAAGGANCKVGAPTDGGLYFQFGSLVGWSTLDPLAIAVKPAGCSVTAWNSSWTGDPATQNLTTGTGDPCRFYLGSPWRLPTSAEFLAAGNYGAQTTGRWFGPTSGWSSSNAVFFPASGRRSSSGALSSVGTNGYYWSSSVISSSNGYNLYFNSSTVSPQYSNLRATGFTVRCVQ